MPNLIIVTTTVNGNVEVEFDPLVQPMMPSAIYKKITFKKSDIKELRLHNGNNNVTVFTGFDDYVLSYEIGIEVDGVTATDNEHLYSLIFTLLGL